MKWRFPFLQFHRCPPVDSLRVHGVPLFPSSQRPGAFAVSPRPGVHGFPVRRLLCPIRPSPRASSIRETFPSHSFPTALPIPREVSRVPHRRLKQNDVGGVFLSLPPPHFAAPHSLDRGEDRVTSVTVAIPLGIALVLTRIARVCFQARLADLSDKGGQGQPFPKGFTTLQVMHHVVPQPSHHLLRACLPLMGPCRSMLLTP